MMGYGAPTYRSAEFRVNDYSAAPAPSWFSHRVELDAEACSGSIIMFGLERIESEEGPQMCRIVEMPPIATKQPFPEHVDLGRGAGGIVPCGGEILPDFDGDDCMAATKTFVSGTPAGDVLLWGVRPGIRYVLTLMVDAFIWAEDCGELSKQYDHTAALRFAFTISETGFEPTECIPCRGDSYSETCEPIRVSLAPLFEDADVAQYFATANMAWEESDSFLCIDNGEAT